MRWWWLGAVAGLSASPAMADWQYTKWGMSPEQVVAASGGAAASAEPLPRARGSQRLVAGSYVIGEDTFDVDFHFGAAGVGLRFVKLSLRDVARCDGLRRPLEDKYGVPEKASTTYGLSLKWRDTATGNLISYFDESGNHSFPACTITYRPIKNEVSDQL